MMRAKPFLKWAGGKTQLLTQIQAQIPSWAKEKPLTYIEPFVGSGATAFWLMSHFDNLERVIINDINTDLINCYQAIRDNVDEVIAQLAAWEDDYHSLVDCEAEKKAYFYAKRQHFNQKNATLAVQSALLIFLNRTCFNGLYRVNRNNAFNVPIGSYKKPQICDAENLHRVSEALQNVTILSDDYAKTLAHAGDNTLFYLDPPYKPLNETSSFTAYAKGAFDDDEQIRLAHFCEQLDDLGHAWVLSNSDVKNTNPDNQFFDELYAKFNITRVKAKRLINAKASHRGQLTELLISN